MCRIKNCDLCKAVDAQLNDNGVVPITYPRLPKKQYKRIVNPR